MNSNAIMLKCDNATIFERILNIVTLHHYRIVALLPFIESLRSF